jgi:phosphatidylglycerophosphatase A
MNGNDMTRLGLSITDPAVLLATWGGCGWLPGAPGTWGSLAALPFAWGIAWLAGPWGLAAASLAVFAGGIWAADAYTRKTGEKDPGAVVIDEVAGQWLTLVPAGLDPLLFVAGFGLFRFFDILKPWPVSWADRKVGGGLGIMLDDLLAGGYGALVLYGLTRVWP